MLIQYEPNVNAAISFVKQLGVKVNNSTVNETLQNHPDYPSLLCISDSLNKWNIPNGAGKIEPDKINELPTPFIAYTNNREYPLIIVSQTGDSTITLYSKNYNKLIIKSKEDFLKTWTGIYLIAEVTKQSGEKEYKQNKKKAFINALIPVSLFALLLIFSFLLLNNTINNFNQFSINAAFIYIQYFILVAGVIVTSLLLWYEIDKSNPFLQKVCTGIAKGNCHAILTGRQSKVFGWFSWSEVGFFYFTGGLLALLFASNIASAISILAWLNILALPYTVFSIYYQWRVAKQWCVLCLTVQALLLMGGVNILANGLPTSFNKLSGFFVLKIGGLYLLPVLLWYAIRPFILRLQESKNTKREYLRIKFNTQIFETLLKKQKQITIPVSGLGIDIGNPAAMNTLIKVCSPYCGPCAKAHPKIEHLLEEIPNLRAKIIFTTPNEPEQLAYNPVSHLLAIDAEVNGDKKINDALDDWYLADKKDYEIFAKKYPMNGELTKQGDKIKAMDKWCEGMDIHATPTIFINGYKLPDAYDIEDLKYFLAE